ncbi:NAD(P)/FAD-dependent oxidoreductase [Nocardia fusca]|uniref:NAD(P)/FAD-dependent oxidoreductase n=1 Tax=Nocardia fusca TaxID=941183 RepID=UPI00378FD38B
MAHLAAAVSAADSPAPRDIVVVGAGQAAAQAVGAIAGAGHCGRVTVIGDEPVAPYQRPPLSKGYLKGAVDAERLRLRSADWYEQHGVGLHTAQTVVSLDRRQKTVTTSGGRVHSFDVAVLATGSRARKLAVPGTDLSGIHRVRTLADIDGLAPGMVAGNRLLVVGAGFIGLELAAVARGLGLSVVVVESAPRCLGRVAAPETAAVLARAHEERGVRFVYERTIVGFTGNKRVESAHLDDGSEVPCDLVVVGIGAVANQELAAAAEIDCDNGILVDLDGRTSDPSIFAAGDCTNRPLGRDGTRGRLESVHNAIEQGNLVAAAVLGLPRPKLDVPWFWSDQYDLKLQMAGVAFDPDRLVVRQGPNGSGFAAFHLKGSRVQVVEAIDAPAAFMVGKRLIASGREVRDEHLADPEFDIKQLMRAS